MAVDSMRKADYDVPTHDNSDGGDSVCMFPDGLCVMPATHALVLPSDELGVIEYRYCARHYVLILAEFLDVHVPTCPSPIVDHYVAFGEIADLEVLPGALDD